VARRVPVTGDHTASSKRTQDASGESAADPTAGDPEALARQVCLKLLTAAPRTRAELAAELRRRRVPDAAAETVLGRFAEVGLIDDAAFARAWVESRHHSRGLSRRSLSAELRRHGVDSEEIREAVEVLDPEQEVATARRLVEQKLARNRGQRPEARARQAAGLLARKGYPPALAFRLISEAMRQEGVPGSSDLDMDADAYLEPDGDDTPENDAPDGDAPGLDAP
jgi:regulatory protein